MLGAEACWVAALQVLDGNDDDRARVLENLAMVEGIISRESSHRVTVADVPAAIREMIKPHAETLSAKLSLSGL